MKLKKFNESFDSWSNKEEINLYYERYMKEYEIIDDYKGLGPGTLFSGDSGYNDDYEEFIDSLKDDIKSYLKYQYEENEMVGFEERFNQIEFIEVDYLKTFIKGEKVSFD